MRSSKPDIKCTACIVSSLLDAAASSEKKVSTATRNRKEILMGRTGYFFSAGVASGAAAGAGAGAAAAGSSSFSKSGRSVIGPLVALMPGAGLGGIDAGSEAVGAGAGVVVAGVSVAFASAGFGSDGAVVGCCASAAVGGGGATAPAGSGAETKNMLVRGDVQEVKTVHGKGRKKVGVSERKEKAVCSRMDVVWAWSHERS
ncbi:hypothetical protein BU26DRAFT_156823 [Trematosphaeria pertusa]|uniref:Uncharacterized protein n=1 Tax=Trematosphaeria pertusa TaxID=390896 RepID=A0A6A6HVX7_9PLEO|nr:uncharacterized protein BU26DRAFT_156823 [Trematosphaeria pertusa]KAF2242207.1 hypothetical protein BU26DRAFT_156823 [Trematosphaeria pertusa]